MMGFFGGKRKEPVWAAPKPAQDLMPEGTAAEAISGEGFFRLAFDRFPLESATAPAEMDVEVLSSPGRSVLLLSGGKPDAKSHGQTEGFSVRVPDTFEAAVSGHRVRVRISAKAARGLPDAEFSLAYSTAEVGNSGWQQLSVGSAFETLEFEWDVPPMINGNGDYVGILPGQSGAIEVAELTVIAVART